MLHMFNTPGCKRLLDTYIYLYLGADLFIFQKNNPDVVCGYIELSH